VNRKGGVFTETITTRIAKRNKTKKLISNDLSYAESHTTINYVFIVDYESDKVT
jgi:hypothetical protein